MDEVKRISLHQFTHSSKCKIGLIFLHTEMSPELLSSQKDFLTSLWSNAIIRCAADSGANFLYDNFANSKNVEMIPDFVCGDFDSIRPEVLEFYQQCDKTNVVPTPDQNETDFTKAFQLVIGEIKKRGLTDEVDGIVAFYTASGRFDHMMANSNTLLRSHLFSEIPLVAISSYDLQFALGKLGIWELVVGEEMKGTYCGLLPFMGASRVTTTGLKWNLDDSVMQFGGLVSTSNEIVDEKVVVRTNLPLVWTMTRK